MCGLLSYMHFRGLRRLDKPLVLGVCNASILIKTILFIQEPFELGEQFHKDLSSEEKSALDTCLRFFDHNRLLCTLYVFIETFVTDAINEPQRFDWE